MLGWYLARGASKDELERLTLEERLFFIANMEYWEGRARNG
ncbi:MAG: hypothetical protein ACLRXL_02065 [Christensenellaceae bacterium]